MLLIAAGTFTILTACAKPCRADKCPNRTLLYWHYLQLCFYRCFLYFRIFPGRSMAPTSVSEILEQAVHSILTIIFAWFVPVRQNMQLHRAFRAMRHTWKRPGSRGPRSIYPGRAGALFLRDISKEKAESWVIAGPGKRAEYSNGHIESC